MVVDHSVAGPVELGAEQLLGQRHADRIGQALAERAGGGFHARGDADLGMAGGLGVQLAEIADLVQGQVVAGQVQQRVQQHRAVPVRQHETVAPGPVRVGRVVAQVPRPQGDGDLGHAHRHAGMAGFGLLDRVGGQKADRIGPPGIGETGIDARRDGGLGIAHATRSRWACRAWAFCLRSRMRQTNGVKMTSMASSILPPGTTIVFARDMNESCSMDMR